MVNLYNENIKLIKMAKFNKVVLFNLFHNGDLHCNRSFVKYTFDYVKSLGLECVNYQVCKNNIYEDLEIQNENLPYINNTYHKKIINNTLYINTWYAANKVLYSRYKVSFDTLYHNFSDVFKTFFGKNISEENVWTFFPKIDYSKCYVNHARMFLHNNKNTKKIFFSNGDVESGQCDNFSCSPIINKISEKYPNNIFLISDKKDDIIKRDNVFFTRDIISKNSCDLNENSYLSTECDTIIGRYSGSFTFALNRNNYNRDVKFIGICNQSLISNYSWINKLPMKYKAKIIGSKNTTFDHFSSLIESNIVV